jgi:N-succinyldiaminopimelate aminotransferase
MRAMPRFPAASPAVAALPPSVYSPLVARLARYAGEKYPFHLGDTWKEPPEVARMERFSVERHPGMHRYPPVPGRADLLAALAQRHVERTGLPTTPEDLLVTGGATAAIGAAETALLAPGDEILILAPYWPLVEGAARTSHAVPVAVPILHRGLPTVAALVTALEAAVTPRTSALYFNTPHNPTGLVFPRSHVEALVAFARRHELWLFADDVYEDLLYDGEHVSARALAPERTLSFHSFSKSCGMAGNRVGWVAGPRTAMEEVRKVALFTWYSAPQASQLAALATLSPEGKAWLAATRAEYADTGARVAEVLGVPAPQGSTFLFLDASPVLDARGLAGFVEDCVEDGLLVAPGPSFGPFPTWIRLCFTAAPPDVTVRGARKLAARLGRSGG